MTIDMKLYSEWLKFHFDRPAWSERKPYAESSPEEQARFNALSEREVFWDDDPRRQLAFLTHTFLNAPSVLPSFTRHQIGEGLWDLTDTISRAMHSKVPSWDEKRDLIRSVYTLFADFFAKDGVSHSTTEAIFHKWWEEFPFPSPWYDSYSKKRGIALPPESQAYYDEVLAVMEKIMQIGEIGCYDSVYHSLDIWQEPTGKAERLKREYATRGPKT
ncbi:MAG: hypothetical protein ACHQ51_03415 [Elusimicrobiota bacterium]